MHIHISVYIHIFCLMMSYMYLFSKFLGLFTGDTTTRRKVGKNWFNSQTCSFVCLTGTTIFIHSPRDFCFRGKHTVKFCPQLLWKFHLVDIDQRLKGCSLVLLRSLSVLLNICLVCKTHGHDWTCNKCNNVPRTGTELSSMSSPAMSINRGGPWPYVTSANVRAWTW